MIIIIIQTLDFLRFAVHLVLSLGSSTKVTEFMSRHFTYYGQKRTTTSKKVAPSLRLKKVKTCFVQSLLHHSVSCCQLHVPLSCKTGAMAVMEDH